MTEYERELFLSEINHKTGKLRDTAYDLATIAQGDHGEISGVRLLGLAREMASALGCITALIEDFAHRHDGPHPHEGQQQTSEQARAEVVQVTEYGRRLFVAEIEQATEELETAALELVRIEQRYGGELRREMMRSYERDMRRAINRCTQEIEQFTHSHDRRQRKRGK